MLSLQSFIPPYRCTSQSFSPVPSISCLHISFTIYPGLLSVISSQASWPSYLFPLFLSFQQPFAAMDMDNLLGGGGGGGGRPMGQFPLEQWFYEMPVCTRWWTVATIATSLLVQCHIITPFQLFYSFRAVFLKNQVLYSR